MEIQDSEDEDENEDDWDRTFKNHNRNTNTVALRNHALKEHFIPAQGNALGWLIEHS